jgi:hypothetical protein
MDDIKSTIAQVLGDLKTRKEKAAAADPAQHFSRVFAKKELSHVKPAYFRKGILAVTVDSATWLYHLSLRKQELIRKMAELSKEVKDIRFVIGEIEPRGAAKKVAKAKERGTIKFL